MNSDYSGRCGEKRILRSINCPFSVRAYYTFDGTEGGCPFEYLILDYIAGGEMYTHLRNNKKFR